MGTTETPEEEDVGAAETGAEDEPADKEEEEDATSSEESQLESWIDRERENKLLTCESVAWRTELSYYAK